MIASAASDLTIFHGTHKDSLKRCSSHDRQKKGPPDGEPFLLMDFARFERTTRQFLAIRHQCLLVAIAMERNCVKNVAGFGQF